MLFPSSQRRMPAHCLPVAAEPASSVEVATPVCAPWVLFSTPPLAYVYKFYSLCRFGSGTRNIIQDKDAGVLIG